ncbi:hypothetical protein JOD57_004242 [Geodermatophilus bullaregiensis]|uniref:hypothetical protein n=1 Tax=Geodermatophilus bullaregiensis TaxID=1564160 RepID=UPI00195CB5B3|nr:hypothetical protein [Geodermatophilus bullaregiensis]MBM7808405.1 hypothetical protein [Geodermatophilus bullaregiensis]
MRTAARLGATVVGLAAVLGAGWGVGTLVGPVGAPAAAQEHAADEGHPDPSPAATADAAPPGGLQVSDRGYTLDLVADELPAGTSPLAFRILGPDGAPVTDYEVDHDEDLHLVAVRRDLTGYQHVHPERGADGTWTTPLELTPGSWRVFADTTPAALGADLTLGADLAVAGDLRPQPLPGPSPTAEVDGYTVVLTGGLVPGRESGLTFSVSRGGVPVTDLQPHLGAYGHLVALRAGDLGYLHVHPVGDPADPATAPGPHVEFAATAPSAGDYRLFLDLRHGDVVRTAEFTVHAGSGPAADTPAAAEPDAAGHGHGDD